MNVIIVDRQIVKTCFFSIVISLHDWVYCWHVNGTSYITVISDDSLIDPIPLSWIILSNSPSHLNVIIYDTIILQYYGHREKLKTIGREGDLEKLNRTALKLAKKVAVKHDKITAAAICNTTLFLPGDDVANATVRANFKVM
jgi:hypothetical protein